MFMFVYFKLFVCTITIFFKFHKKNLIDWLINLFIDWLIDLLIDRSIDLSIDRMIDAM